MNDYEDRKDRMVAEYKAGSNSNYLILKLFSKLKPWQVIGLLLLLAMFSGALGNISSDRVLPLIGIESSVNRQIEEQVDALKESLSSVDGTLSNLNRTLIGMERTIINLDDILIKTRCEVRAAREGLDWRDCWIAGDTVIIIPPHDQDS